MADVQLNSSGRRKAHSLRVDLTPMVDLGFILICFFLYTTTITKYKVVKINMPYQPAKASTAFTDTSTITLIPIKGHKVLYYSGMLGEKDLIPISKTNLNDLLPKKKNQLKELPDTYSERAHQLQVIIKPHESCTYEDVVDLIDAMQIHAVSIYTIADLNEEELKLIERKL